jgi:imidazoleglycerol phosphate dehydratase HisB
MRSATRSRETRETKIGVTLNLDGSGPPVIATGLRMLDHLLEQFAFHSGCSLQVRAESLDGIQHHVVEDVAIVIGDALAGALGDRSWIERYGCAIIPMDDALARAAVDLGGRAYTRTELPLGVEQIEGLAASMIPHFFSSLASNARITLHIDLLAGTDPHHCVEAAFKALARACAGAWSQTRSSVASTKGVL